MQPISLCTSFKAIDEFILNMLLSFSRLTSMPRYDTMKPSSFPEGTPKTHFLGFRFHLKHLKFVNISDIILNPGLDDDIVNICFHVASELIMQVPLHGSIC